MLKNPGERSSNEPPCRVAVIGGGISGLAAANRLIELTRKAHQAIQVSLFEAGPRLGGVIHSERVGDYLAELGADSFITNKPWGTDLCGRLGLADRLISTDPRYRQALVLRDGKPVPVPDGFLLMAPAKIWPIVTSPIFTPIGKLRMGLELLVPRRTETADESVAAFVRRRFGAEALERLVQPLVAGIYTSDPEKLSLQATLPRFVEMERQHRSLILAARCRRETESSRHRAGESAAGPRPGDETKAHVAIDDVPESGARYGLFVALRGGLSELVDALTQRLEEAGRLQLNAAAIAIEPLVDPNAGFALRVADGKGGSRTETFQGVVLAVPAYRAAALVQAVDAKMAVALNEIEYASSAIVVTGHALADIADPLQGSGLVVPRLENRPILSVSFASRKFAGRAPEGKVLLRTFVGGALQPELMHESDDALAGIVLDELRKVLGVRGEPDFALVSRHERAMPQYHVGHLERVGKIEGCLDRHPRLALAGNAYSGVGIPDCIQSGEAAAERVFRTLS